MVWQERIGRYQQEQVCAQNEARRRAGKVQEQQRIERVEKIRPLLKVLETLGCEEMFTQIRDEIWRLGEVSILPDLSQVTYDTPIEAKAVLRATWPFLGICRSGHKEGPIGEERWVNETKEGELIHEEVLEIKLFWRKGKLVICKRGNFGRKSINIDKDSLASLGSSLERLLVEDCSKRLQSTLAPPYDEVARNNAVELKRWKKGC